jgi:hypothetical protein
MLIVLATWEAESGGLKFYTSLGRNVGWQDSLNGKKQGNKANTCHPNYGRKPKTGGLWVMHAWA